jgi:transposase
MKPTRSRDGSPGRPARLLDVVEERTADAYGSWLHARRPEWRSRIRLAALDPFRGYLNALRAPCGVPKPVAWRLSWPFGGAEYGHVAEIRMPCACHRAAE